MTFQRAQDRKKRSRGDDHSDILAIIGRAIIKRLQKDSTSDPTDEEISQAVTNAVNVHAFVASFFTTSNTEETVTTASSDGMLSFEQLQDLAKFVDATTQEDKKEDDPNHTLHSIKAFLMSTGPKAVVFDKSHHDNTIAAAAKGQEVEGDAGEGSPQYQQQVLLRWTISVGDLVFAITNVASANSSIRDRRTVATAIDGATDSSPLMAHFRALLLKFPRFNDNPEEIQKFWDAVNTALPMTLRIHNSEPALYRLAHHALLQASSSTATTQKEGLAHSPLFSLGTALESVQWLTAPTPTNNTASEEDGGSYKTETFQCTHEHYHAATVTPPVASPYAAVLNSNDDNNGNQKADDATNFSVEAMCRTLHASGLVSFQEVVSMLPVLALGIQSHHRVLDMCAAPGSKTLLAADMTLGVCRGATPAQLSSSTSSSSQFSKVGVILANEKDRAKATQTLPARVKRHHAPNMIVTRGDATAFPLLFTTNRCATLPTPTFDRVSFDRVICDVPCSGDGTVRKEASIRGTWSEKYVESLVPIQINALRRGIDALVDGGIIAYSTCSLNPKEDEEVLYKVIKSYSPGTIEILDVRKTLTARLYGDSESSAMVFPGGNNGYKVRDPVDSTADPKYHGHRDVDVQVLSQELADKTLRVFPQDYNTGGFFVALLRKLKVPENQPLPVITSHKLNNWMGKKRFKLLVAVSGGHATWESIAKFYGISPAWDANPPAGYENATVLGGLIPVAYMDVKGEGPLKRIQLMTPETAKMLLNADLFKGSGVEIVMAGIRAFELFDGKFLSEAPCRWRVVAEAASILGEHLQSQATPAFNRQISIPWTTISTTASASLPQLLCNPQRAFWELLRHGFISVDALSTATTDCSHHQGVSSCNCLLARLIETGLVDRLTVTEEGGCGIHVHSGSIMIAVDLPAAISPSSTKLWLSATLSPRKIELCVDVSMRQFGLLAMYGVDGSSFIVKQQAKDIITPNIASTEGTTTTTNDIAEAD